MEESTSEPATRQVRDYDANQVLAPCVMARTLQGADGLALIARFGEGYDNVDVDANMTTDPQIVSIPIEGKQVRIRLLDETNALAAMIAPDTCRSSEWETLRSNGSRLTLELRPHCLLRVDTHRD